MSWLISPLRNIISGIGTDEVTEKSRLNKLYVATGVSTDQKCNQIQQKKKDDTINMRQVQKGMSLFFENLTIQEAMNERLRLDLAELLALYDGETVKVKKIQTDRNDFLSTQDSKILEVLRIRDIQLRHSLDKQA